MEEIKQFDLKQAIKYMEETYVLATVVEDNLNYIVKKGDKIVVSNANSMFSLSMKEFVELYKDAKFSLVEEDEESVDLKKDEEYYSWGKKM